MEAGEDLNKGEVFNQENQKLGMILRAFLTDEEEYSHISRHASGSLELCLDGTIYISEEDYELIKEVTENEQL